MSGKSGTRINVTIKGDKVSSEVIDGDQKVDIDITPDEAEDWGESLKDMAAVLKKETARKSRRRIP